MTAPGPAGNYDAGRTESTDRRCDIGAFATVQAGGSTARVYETGRMVSGTPGVIVFHAWWGLNDDVVAFADRLAASDFAVAAPDLFGGPVAATVEEADQLSESIDEAAADATALAAIDRLRDRLGRDGGLGAVGFSMGGAWSMWSPGQRQSVVASVVYYGSIEGPSLTRATVPVLGHFAETDPYESDEAVAKFEATLQSAGREVTIYRYPGTGHWFAEPSKDAYRQEAADIAFARTVQFLRHHLRPGNQPQ